MFQTSDLSVLPTDEVPSVWIPVTDLAIKHGLYGRREHIERLMEALERTHHGAGELMLVPGTSGTGKTTLVEFLKEPVRTRNGYFLVGKFNQFDRNVPYSAIRRALAAFVVGLLDEGATQRQRWKDELLAAVAGQGQMLIELVPELEALIGAQPITAKVSLQEAKFRFANVIGAFMQVLCRPEHPIVLFLDDCQWADAASLALLEQLQIGSTLRFLLVVASYRSDEVDEAHPLESALRTLRSQATPIHILEVANLTASDLSRLVEKNLANDDPDLVRIASLVHSKTKGNPFFARAYINFLYESGFITGYGFRCSEPELIDEHDDHLPADVVSLYVRRLERLDVSQQRLLALAACLGHQFDADSLAIISQQSLDDCLKLLEAGVVLELIVPLELPGSTTRSIDMAPRKRFRFLHDRVQQAAMSLIDAKDVPCVRLGIARNLLDRLDAQQIDDRLFEVVEHLNSGANLIQDHAEQIGCIELNVAAARKARSAVAYRAALQFHRSARLLVDAPGIAESLWNDYHGLAMSLLMEQAETEFLEGDLAEAEHCVRRAVAGARTPEQKADALQILIMQQTLMGRYSEAIATGREALAALGMELPNSGYATERDSEIENVRRALNGKTAADLGKLPVASNPTICAAVSVMISLGPPCYRSHQELWSVIVPRVVSMMLEYGTTSQIGYSHPAFAGLLMWVAGDIKTAREVCDHATTCMEATFTSQAGQSVFHLMMGSSGRHWFEHLAKASEDYDAAYQVGLASGNLQYAAYAFGHNMYCRFYQGVSLANLIQYTQQSIEFSRKRQNRWASELLEGGLELFQDLAGSDDHDRGVGAVRNSRVKGAEHSDQVACIHMVLQTSISLILGDHQRAVSLSDDTQALIHTVGTQGLLPWPEYVFARSLALAAVADAIDAEQAAERQREVGRLQSQLYNWAAHCPANFEHKYLLVAAEIARLEGRILDAAELYSRAISTAREGGFTHWEGVANERCSRFWRSRGNGRLEQVHWQQAYDCFERWGARAKLERMESEYGAQLVSDMAVTLPADHTESDKRDRMCQEMAHRHLAQLRTQYVDLAESQAKHDLAKKAQDLAYAAHRLRTDVAEQKKAAVVRQEQHDALVRCVVEAMPNAVVAANANSRIVLVNAQTEALFGYSRNELLGQSIELLVPDQHWAKHSDYFAADAPNVRPTGTRRDFQVRRKDGSEFPVEIGLNLIESENGPMILAAIVDISRRKRLERIQMIRQQVIELLTREHSLSRAMELLALETEALEPSLRCSVLTLNRGTGQLRYCAAPSLPHDFSQAVDGLHIGENVGSCGAAAYRMEPVIVEDVDTHLNWQAFRGWPEKVGFGACWSIPILNLTNQVLGTFAIYHREKRRPTDSEHELIFALADVAAVAMEHDEFVQILKQSNAELEQFAYVASHDLQEPLRMVSSYMDLVAERYRGKLDAKADLYIGYAVDGAIRMKAMIKDLLTYSQVGRKDGTLELTDCRAVVEAVLANLQQVIQERDAKIVFDGLPIVQADKGQLTHVFQNLLSNALKFCDGKPPRVHIRANRRNKEWVFAVQDNGIGIAPEYHERIFTIFQRLHTREEYPGTGIGLAVCKKVVERHHGRMWLESQPSEGTTFYFTLPQEQPS